MHPDLEGVTVWLKDVTFRADRHDSHATVHDSDEQRFLDALNRARVQGEITPAQMQRIRVRWTQGRLSDDEYDRVVDGRAGSVARGMK